MRHAGAARHLVRLAAFSEAAEPGFRLTRGARRALEQTLRAALAVPNVRVRTLGRGAGVRAAVLLGHQGRSDEAWPVQTCTVLGVPDDEVALRWLNATLAELAQCFDRRTFTLALPPHLRALLPGLARRDVGISSVRLVGEPQVALARLCSAQAIARDLAAHSVEIRPLVAGAIPAVLDLRRRIFAAQPQWCWFGADRSFLKGEARRLRLAVHDPLNTLEVLWRDAEVVGFAAMQPSHRAGIGAVAGMDLLLAPALRGRGVVKTLYRRLLEAAVARSVPYFAGHTAQPAVMALGRRMGRVSTTLDLRRAPHLPPGWFGSALR